MSCAIRSGRRGLTLIEVMSGVALLSTLLVGVLLAFGRLAKQMSGANRVIQAVAVADNLLASWHEDDVAVPLEQSGSVPGFGSLQWDTAIVNAELVSVGVVVVRLTIRDRLDPDRNALVTVDLLANEMDGS